MLRALKWLAALSVALGLGLAMLTLATSRGADASLYPPSLDSEPIPVFVVDHGYHAGLVVPRARLSEAARRIGSAPLIAVTERFGEFEWLEIGWGDEGFYRNVARVSPGTLHHVARALFWPGNRSILHVVGFSIPVEDAWPDSPQVRLEVSQAGFDRLARHVGGSFVLEGGQPVDAGPGLYGPSRFFAAQGDYSLLNLCNHWTGQALAAAGLPYAPVPSTLSAGLVADLQWRAAR